MWLNYEFQMLARADLQHKEVYSQSGPNSEMHAISALIMHHKKIAGFENV